jgi:hypothetical protein
VGRSGIHWLLLNYWIVISNTTNTTNTTNDDDTAVFFEGGGVWNQNAATDFQLYNQSYGTRLRRGNDHSFIDMLIWTHTGVVIKGQGTWNQNSDTTITVSQGRGTTTTLFMSLLFISIHSSLFIISKYFTLSNGSAVLLLWVRLGVLFVNESGVWNQAPTAQISLTCKNSSIGTSFST